MSDKSKIEWTDASWPVTVGCDHISAGCDHCYAATLASGRLSRQPAYAGLAEHGRFNGTVRCLPERLDWPQRWRKPRRIFVCSMSDLFHQSVPDTFIARVFAVMAGNSRHTFQVLTKRHDRMRSFVRGCQQWDGYITHNGEAPAAYGGTGVIVGRPESWPLPNVWLGVSAEDQKWAEIRVHALLSTPAAVRWVSAEPLLGPIDLRNLKARNGALIDALHGDVKAPDGTIYAACPGSVSWVVAGGESGAGARPMHPDWARSLRDQCRDARVPYLFKQWGSHRWVAHSAWDEATQCWTDDGVEPQRVSKKLAGRELDGRTWDEYPGIAEGAAA
jgi:protein gp37